MARKNLSESDLKKPFVNKYHFQNYLNWVDLAGIFKDLEFRAALTVTYYSLAFAYFFFKYEKSKKTNIFHANAYAYVIFKT
jgi:hypothetical protein